MRNQKDCGELKLSLKARRTCRRASQLFSVMDQLRSSQDKTAADKAWERRPDDDPKPAKTRPSKR